MKTLLEYLQQKINILEKEEESKTFTFDFSKMEKKDEILKSLEDKPGVDIEDDKVSVKVSKGANLESTLDVLQQSINTLRKSQTSINDEQYAQKTKTLATTLSDLFDYQDKIEHPEEDENGKKNKKDDEEE